MGISYQMQSNPVVIYDIRLYNSQRKRLYIYVTVAYISWNLWAYIFLILYIQIISGSYLYSQYCMVFLTKDRHFGRLKKTFYGVHTHYSSRQILDNSFDLYHVHVP